MLHISINMFFSCRFFTRNRPVYGAKTAKQRGKNKKSICARVLCYEKKYKQKQIVRSPSHGVFRVRVGGRTFRMLEKDDTKVDQSEISTDQTTDSSRIKNGSFEFDTEKETTPIVTSPKNWSRSSVLTSKAASGVVDTETSAWDKLTKSGNITPTSESEAAEKWADMNTYDRLQYIKKWKDANKNKSVDDLKFYKNHYNISADDIPSSDVNPGTHYAEGSDEAKKNSKVLMIHNQYSSSSGTAQTSPPPLRSPSPRVQARSFPYG